MSFIRYWFVLIFYLGRARNEFIDDETGCDDDDEEEELSDVDDEGIFCFCF